MAVLSEYTKGQIEHVTFRNLVYMFSQLIAIHRLEKDIDIEKTVRTRQKSMSNCRNKAVKLNRHLVVKTDVKTQTEQEEHSAFKNSGLDS